MLIQSDTMTPSEFVWKILERDARNIYRAQHLVVSQRIYLSGKDLKATKRKKGVEKKTGTLENSLANPDFHLHAEGEKFILASGYPLYIRFLDMKRLGNWKIYNRQIWGILYNNALKDIKERYGNYIGDTVGDALRAAVEKFNKK